MCGRFVGAYSTERLLEELAEAAGDVGVTLHLDADIMSFGDSPNYNVAPTQAIPVLFPSEGRITSARMNWGLIPRWATDTSRASSMINARSETVTEKASFRGLVKGHRCVVPMDGFYEWDRTDPRHKVPYFVHREDARLLLVAGLWSASSLVSTARTFCILTRESGDDLAGIHDRCPVHLDAEQAIEWMCADDAPLELTGIDDHPRLQTRRVGFEVNSVRHNGPTLIEEAKRDTETVRETLF